MSTIGYISQATIAQNIANLPHYKANNFRDLPADAAGEGVFADGDVYYETYDLLTPNDTSLVESITSEKSVQGDPLAGAIGTDRADVAIGWGGLTGDVTTGYLASIEATEANGDGTYDGFKVSSAELNAAIDYLSANGSTAGVSSSASGLTGNLAANYIASIESAETTGTYDSLKDSSRQLNAAIGDLSARDEKPGSTASVSVSA